MRTTENQKKQHDSPLLDYALVLDYSPKDPDNAANTLEIIKRTDEMMKEHCRFKADALSYTQLRNILQELKNNRENPVIVIPKLAYIEARQEKSKQKNLVEFIRNLLQKSIEQNKVDGFFDYMDSLVAYHKYYSSK